MNGRLHDTIRALRFLARNPQEAWDRAHSRTEHVLDRHTRSPAPVAYERALSETPEQLHDRIGVPFPCEASSEFDLVWNEIGESLAEAGSFVGNWAHDAQPGLGRIVWCLVRHLRPQRVVETGVARGITTRVLLEALESNGHGQLWSIDLPVLRSHWYEQTAVAVPPSFRSRWTYLRGSSRRHLRRLLRSLGEIDLFIHDSAHTERNMLFEFQTAWPALSPAGVLVSDDIIMNSAFATFAATVSSDPVFARYGDGVNIVGILVKGS